MATTTTTTPTTPITPTTDQTTGLINTVAQATPGQAVGTGYTAAQTTLNQGADTVQGQLDSLLKSDSPLQQQAKTTALESMNGRGLLNSSMAVGAAQQAMNNTALQVAQQDANTNATVNRENTAATNSAQQFSANAGNSASATNAQIDSSTNQFNASQSNDMTKLGLDIASKNNLANIEASYKTLMQGNQSASTIYQQSVKNITDIMANQNMGQEAKDAAVQNQIAMLQKGMELTGAMANLDLSQYLDFSSIPT